MSNLLRPLFLVVIAIAMSSCTVGRSQECAKIITLANETVDETKTITDGQETTDPEAALLASDTMELAAKEMADLNISDPQLQTYQNQFIQMYEETAEATRSFVQAYNNQEMSELELAREEVKKATVIDQELVTKINDYCLE
ncbi:hypothetical protein FRE64_15325 [Euhalothece natronophila Z-M001]|uniref:Uncharacterized protein n=1 Tax=Euhalothece natronophila Z-M001 TaxID=522448 RepID=A0A5B8NQ89_9CHRO|nr:hypothetical protein [Euhalothece natronophila]QDZ41194.1 hypothetical protein FRE64_15325 [Euhalothece natronophila Z-M001]